MNAAEKIPAPKVIESNRGPNPIWDQLIKIPGRVTAIARNKKNKFTWVNLTGILVAVNKV
tara:strand:- start:513 stop:692 length:180 start_codon:yes stop_codon:yes gene_type:complete